jgi:uncharacterized protein YcfL
MRLSQDPRKLADNPRRMTMTTRPKTTLKGASMILAALIGATHLACSSTTTSNVAVGQIMKGETGEVLQKDYIIKDKPLAKEIQVLDIQARLVGDFLEGLAVLQNQRKYTIDFEYRFEWYDETGVPVESSIVHWTPDLLYGRQSKWIRALCPKPNATGFKVMIRRPEPVEE